MKNIQARQLIKVILLAAFAVAISFSSCKKDDSEATPQEKQEFAMAASQSDAEAEGVFDDLFDNAMGVNDEVGIGGAGIFGLKKPPVNEGPEVLSKINEVDSNTCFIVSTTQLGGTRFPLQVTVDFGGGCLCRDGRTRRGKIIITYTGRLVVPGNSATVTFDGYTVSDIQVQGTYKIINTGTAGAKSFTMEVGQAKLTKPNGNFTEWNSTRIITQTDGGLTPLIAIDDVFSISGGADGRAKRGDRIYQWSTQITDPLIKRFNCFRIVKGTIGITKGNAAVAVLDYGTGVCDNKATLTVNGTAYEITLH
jgi:hypothetical protein